MRVDIRIDGAQIAAVEAAGRAPAGGPACDVDGGQVWPAFVDIHTHLDKGHIWPRQPNPDGSFEGALAATQVDRAAHWSAADVRARMDFSLRTAYAHGTRAIRTHIDSIPPQEAVSWPVFAALRDEWAGRIALQGVNLVPLPYFADADAARAQADLVADFGGILGAVCYIDDDAPALLDRTFTLASERGLDLDFHVDEGLDPEARSLKLIVETARRSDFAGRVNCGHCCAFSIQADDYVEEVLGLVADAGLAVTSLPMCNMYLQDRNPGRTPRRRGVTLLHEFRARGIPVSVSSDNLRDPFYGYGDLDPLEVFTQATRIAHLDHPHGDWPSVVTTTPAAIMGLDGAARIGAGRPADLVLFRGRGFSELLSRRQADRSVLRAGRPIDTAPPDYRELDALFEGAGR